MKLIIGDDGHGYCRTYGCSAPPRLVHTGSSSTPASNDNMIQKLVDKLVETAETFDKKLDALRDEMMLAMATTDRVTAQSEVPTTSVHLKESIGDEELDLSPTGDDHHNGSATFKDGDEELDLSPTGDNHQNGSPTVMDGDEEHSTE